MADDLEKMAVADLPPGQRTRQPVTKWAPKGATYNYDHLLPAEHRGAYSLRLLEPKDMPGTLGAFVLQHGVSVGQVTGRIHAGGSLGIGQSELQAAHRGRGLATAAYEALMTHAYHNHGARVVEGATHSTGAHEVHQRLAAKHGLAYQAAPTGSGGPAGDFDARFGDYAYELKSELQKDEVATTGVATPRPRPRARKPKAPEGQLAVVHNLSAGNLQHVHDLGGGIPAPSLAVVHKDHGMDNFGEISLVAHAGTIDPKHTPVFNADVYSPRWPRAKYRINEKPLTKLKGFLKPYLQRVGASDHASYSIAENVERGGHHDAAAHPHHDVQRALGLAFLEERGHQLPPAPLRAKPLAYEWLDAPPLQQFFAQHGVNHNFEHGGAYHHALSAAARAGVEHYFKTHVTDDPELAQDLINTSIEHSFQEDGRLFFNPATKLVQDAAKVGQTEVDPHAVGAQIDEAVAPHQDEFQRWAEAKLKPVEGAPYIEKGFNRKAAYTLDNIFKDLTKKIRGGEGFNYGLGSVRSQGAKQFRSLDGIRQEAHKLVPKEQFQKLKAHNDERFLQIAGKLAQHHDVFRDGKAFGQLDDLTNILGDSMRGKSLTRGLAAGGYKNLPPELVAELRDFGQDLLDMPTEYFEAKPQRVVPLSEFEAAVVPHDVKPETLALLRQHGIQHVETYQRTGNEDQAQHRAAAVARVAARRNLLLAEAAVPGEPLRKAEAGTTSTAYLAWVGCPHDDATACHDDACTHREAQASPACALVLVQDGTGRILLGKRRDNGKWTLPAGHLEPGEAPLDGARRELHEETGLACDDLTFARALPLPRGGRIHCFTALCPGTPHGRNDPDQEVEEWRWVDARDGLPQNIYDNLAGPEGDANFVRQAYDLKKGAGVWLDAGYIDLRKRQPAYDPDAALAPHQEEAVANWQAASDEKWTDKNRPTREGIPRMEGAARARGLHRMVGKTAVRVGPDGQRSFLMHRAMSPKEATAAVGPTHVKHAAASSWTPVTGAPPGELYNLLQHFRREYGGPIVSAWVPEGKIRAMLPMWGAADPHAVANDEWTRENTSYDGNVKTRGPGYQSRQWEVLVDPHESPLATPKEQAAAFADDHERLDTRINERAARHLPALSGYGRRVVGGQGPQALDPAVYRALGKAALEACARCAEPATTRVLWAEGMAYQPACDAHKEALKAHYADDFSGYRAIKKTRVYDHNVHATYIFPDAGAAEAFAAALRHSHRSGLWDDAWKGLGTIAARAAEVDLTTWGEGDMDDAGHLAVKHGGAEAAGYGGPLQKAARDPYVYHVTFHGRLPGIAAHGLQPNQRAAIGTAAYDANRRGRVFFTTGAGAFHWHSKAQDHSFDQFEDPLAEGGVPVVLRAPRQPLGRLAPDKVANQESISSHAHYARAAVPPDQLEVFTGAAWVPVRDHHTVPAAAATEAHQDDGAYVSLRHDSPLFPPELHPSRGFTKAESEVHTLLGHPDPRERALALKLDTATPHDLAVGILDPHPTVWRAAFAHPHAQLAHDVLAAHTRDAAGATLFDRHDALLQHPDAHPRHVAAMAAATRADAHLPLPLQLARLLALRAHPLHAALQKSEAARALIARGSHGNMGYTGLVNHPAEAPRSEHQHLAQAYHQHVVEGAAAAAPDHRTELQTGGGYSPKAVYKVPVPGHPAPQRLMVKPYQEKDYPLSGWAEGSSQHLFHAAGLGDMHQKSFVAPHGTGETAVPATVIHIEDASPAGRVAPERLRRANPAASEQARRLLVMDYLTGNHDRHANNLMVRPDHSLLAIDNGLAFAYGDPAVEANASYRGAMESGHSVVAAEEDDGAGNDDHYHLNTIRSWWPTVAPAVRRAFEDRLDLVTSHGARQRLQDGFNARASWLDAVAAGQHGPRWMTEVPPGLEATQDDQIHARRASLAALDETAAPG